MYKNKSKKAFSISSKTKLSLSLCVMSLSLVMLGCNQENQDSVAVTNDAAPESSIVDSATIKNTVEENIEENIEENVKKMPVMNNSKTDPETHSTLTDTINTLDTINTDSQINNTETTLDADTADVAKQQAPESTSIETPLTENQSPEDIMLEALALADDVE